LEEERVQRQKDEKEKADIERLEREIAQNHAQQQEQDKAKAAENESLARQRAQEAMKKMLAVPGGYDQ
jgi:hypothetical protein